MVVVKNPQFDKLVRLCESLLKHSIEPNFTRAFGKGPWRSRVRVEIHDKSGFALRCSQGRDACATDSAEKKAPEWRDGIFLNGDTLDPTDRRRLHGKLAHELFHQVQYDYGMPEAGGPWNWVIEGMARWVEVFYCRAAASTVKEPGGRSPSFPELAGYALSQGRAEEQTLFTATSLDLPNSEGYATYGTAPLWGYLHGRLLDGKERGPWDQLAVLKERLLGAYRRDLRAQTPIMFLKAIVGTLGPRPTSRGDTKQAPTLQDFLADFFLALDKGTWASHAGRRLYEATPGELAPRRPAPAASRGITYRLRSPLSAEYYSLDRSLRFRPLGPGAARMTPTGGWLLTTGEEACDFITEPQAVA